MGLLPFIVPIVSLFSPALGFDSFEIIDHRQKEMKIAQTLTRDINAKLLVNDFTGAVTSAQKIVNWSRNLRRLFPEGSEASVQNLSSASSDIWENPKAFQKALEKIRKKQVGTDNQEFIEGMVCVAVPICDRRKRFFATLSIHAPSSRMTLEEISRHVPRLQKASHDLSLITDPDDN